MKSSKSAPNTPEYAQLLGQFDAAQSAYEQAKANERAVKHTLKTDEKNLSKVEEEVLRLTLNNAKHARKAAKANVLIAQLLIKHWLKTNEAATAKAAEASKKHGPKSKNKKEVEEDTSKKRGRPAGAEKTVVDGHVEAATEAVEAPKKRGRQPKAIEVVVAPTPKKGGGKAKNVEATAEVAAPLETVAEVAEAPKKDSRKAKTVDSVEETVATEPKKRGRQKAAEVEVEEGVTGASAREMEAQDPTTQTVAPKEKRPRRSTEDIAAEKAAAEAAIKSALNGDDFRIIEGVGPKVTSVLHANGFIAFQDLADANYDELKALMISNRQYLANPTNWARQAALVAAGKMEELDALKKELKNGL